MCFEQYCKVLKKTWGYHMFRNTYYRQNIAYGYFNILQQIFINLLSLYLLLFFMHAQVSSKIIFSVQRMCCNLITRRSCPFETTMSDLDLSLIKNLYPLWCIYPWKYACSFSSNLCQNDLLLHLIFYSFNSNTIKISWIQ